MDRGIALVRDEVMPAALAMDGCSGLSMLCERESGRSITTTAWSTHEAMTAGEQAAQQLRDRATELFGAEPTVDRWEIAVLHRDTTTGEGACVRCTWLRMDPAAIDHAVDTYRMATLPALQDMDGFCSASLMVDRSAGRVVSSATFSSRDAMVASRTSADRLRSRTADDLSAQIERVEEFELVLAHLHVPEMA